MFGCHRLGGFRSNDIGGRWRLRVAATPLLSLPQDPLRMRASETHDAASVCSKPLACLPTT
jgi:hypothetical protein